MNFPIQTPPPIGECLVTTLCINSHHQGAIIVHHITHSLCPWAVPNNDTFLGFPLESSTFRNVTIQLCLVWP